MIGMNSCTEANICMPELAPLLVTSKGWDSNETQTGLSESDSSPFIRRDLALYIKIVSGWYWWNIEQSWSSFYIHPSWIRSPAHGHPWRFKGTVHLLLVIYFFSFPIFAFSTAFGRFMEPLMLYALVDWKQFR